MNETDAALEAARTMQRRRNIGMFSALVSAALVAWAVFDALSL